MAVEPDDSTSQRQVLSRALALLSSSLDFEETLAHTIAACLPALGDFGFFDIVVTPDEVRRTPRAHQADDIESLLRPTQWVRRGPGGPNLCALSSGEAALHAGLGDDWYRSIAENEPHLALLRALAFRSMITVPMRFRDELVGALTLFMGRSGRVHDESLLRFAGELAALAAPVVANARLSELHRRAEEALRASEERSRLAMEGGKLGIWDWEIPTNRVTWTERVYELHGVPPGGFGGRVEDFAQLVHPDDRAFVATQIERALRHDAEYDLEFRVPQSDGSVRWLATRAHVVRDAAGNPVRMVGSTQDVTERVELLAAERAAREAAERARQRLELLAAAGAVLSGSLEPQATLQAIASLVVPAIADWCRVDLIDADGVPARALTYHSDPEKTRIGIELVNRLRAAPGAVGSLGWVMQTGQSHIAHFDPPDAYDEIRDRDLLTFARAIGMRAYCAVPLVAHNRTLGALAVLQAESGRRIGEDDRALVTELSQRAALALDNARLYAEAETARQQAETASRTKDEFLAMLGHELRNPLAPIVTALHLMAARGDDAPAERKIIERQVAHLSRLVDDLLDVARITRGRVELQREPVDLHAIVQRALELAQPLLEKREHAIELDLAQVPVMVDGDPVRLAQVLGNLLTNSAKFTAPDKRIVVQLRQQGDRAELVVEDEGCGIEPNLLPRIFDAFTQGAQPVDRRAGGLGLGLAIVRTLVLAHGGTVTAQSDGLGHGCRFTVVLPMGAARPLAEPRLDAPAPSARNAQILVVDDNADAAETLSRLLEHAGYRVCTAADGPSALALIASVRPEVAILDIGLPQMDGYELAGRLRERLDGAPLRLVALTGYGRAPDRDRALSAQFDEHLVKPVPTDRLLATLRSLLDRP